MQTGKPKREMRTTMRDVILVLVILFLIAEIAVFVHMMGGTDSAFPHMMYIPIILAAYYFSTNATILFSALGGIALGPWMARNVELSLTQMPYNWLFRMAFFIIIGVICSLLFQRVNHYRKTEVERSYVNFMTGLPNMNKLRADLVDLIDKKQNFSLVSFKAKNINSIVQNISYDIGLSAMKMALSDLEKISGGMVYSIYANEFAVLLPDTRVDAAYEVSKQYLEKTLEPYAVDGVHVVLLISGGIVSFPLNAVDPDELIKKMGIALEQTTDDDALCVYNDDMDRQSKAQATMIPMLLNAVKNKEFYLVYQPKLSLKGDGQRRVEALIRWNNSKLGPVSPAYFIKLAEEIGFIGEITKWVARSTINQSRAWQEAGMSIKIAINVSPKDLSNADIVSYYRRVVSTEDVDLSMFELELTERAILDNRDLVISRFNRLRDKGLRIALDDYGVGYNSLINMVQVPADYIKIDKTFIDHIAVDDSYRLIIEHTISAAHQTGRQVVAEGVEHKEQLDVLRQMGCDYVQGYYYSRPLLPDDLIEFYKKEESRTGESDPAGSGTAG